MRVADLLTERGIPFERLHHRPVYTADRVAQELHVPGNEVAKSVIVRAGDNYVMVVLPSTRRVDLERLREILGEEDVAVASEAEMDRLFPDCELGAMPPFGSMYHLPTIVDEALAEDEEIVFEAQTHEDAIRMNYRDFENLEHPRHGRFGMPM